MTPTLSLSDRSELDHLNYEVEAALRRRREWLDERMGALSPLRVGDEIYDVDRGERLGIVTEIYRRFAARHHGIYDSDLVIEYEYLTDSGSLRHGDSPQVKGIALGPRAEAATRAARALERLSAPLLSGLPPDDDSEAT